ncbi:MAG: phage tail tape measure protein [Bariatricus sp.]
MAETVRIEVPIEAVDRTSAAVSSACKSLERLYKEMERNTKGATQFDQRAQQTQQQLSKWARARYEIKLIAKDYIAPALLSIGRNLKNITGKAWSVTLKAIDHITAPVRGIFRLLRNPLLQAGAVLGVSFGVKESVDAFKDFEAALSNVKAISGASEVAMEKIKKKAEELGDTTKFTATETAEAFKYMAMAGWDSNDMLGGIEGIMNLAAASGEEIATVSDIVTDALTAFGMKASESGHFSDVLAAASSNANTNVSMMGETFKYAGTMAGTLGYSIEDVALMTGLMANSGVKASMAGTAMNTIFTRLSTNTRGARDAIEKIGISFYDSTGKARRLKDVMDELREKTAGYTDKQKSSLAKTVAGVEAQKGLLAVLNATEKDYKKLADACENADGDSAKMAETMMDNLQGQLTLLSSALDGVKRNFGERLKPYVGGIADWLTSSMPEVNNAIDEFMDSVDQKIELFKDKFSKITASVEWQDADIFGKGAILWDEFISKPLQRWWESTGKQKVSEIAGNIGNTIGTGLSTGIMALLGIDIESTVSEGESIGRRFAKGFADGFDLDAINKKLPEAFGNLFSNAGKLLPGGQSADLSSILSAALLAKIATPLIGFGGKGISATAKVIGSASAGTGLLGLGTRTAIGLGAGNLAGGASLGAGGLSILGLGTIAGGVAGTVGVISGAKDYYKAYKSTDAREKEAYDWSAGTKVGGVLAGAGAGAAIGSVVPVVGTAAGALIGAGIGGIAGMLAGNKKVENYQKEVAEEKKRAEELALTQQKTMYAAGIYTDKVKFKTKELNNAIKDSSVSVEEFGMMFQKACSDNITQHFGKIKLSLSDIKDVSESIVFGNKKGMFDKLESAKESVQQYASEYEASVRNLDKLQWKAQLGFKFDETGKDEFISECEQMAENAKNYIENQHYEANLSFKLLLGKKASKTMIQYSDQYYTDVQNQVTELSKKLEDTIEKALEDGTISTKSITLPDGTIKLSEAKEIENLQNQISNIMQKLSEAEANAEIDVMATKYGRSYSGAALDTESFQGMLDQLKLDGESLAKTYEEAYKTGLTNINLMDVPDNVKEQMQEQLKNGYLSNMQSLDLKLMEFPVKSIVDAYGASLDGLLPEMKGTTEEKLTEAIKELKIAVPDISLWTDESARPNIAKALGLDTLDQETQGAIISLMQQVAQTFNGVTFENEGASAGASYIDSFISAFNDDKTQQATEQARKFVEQYQKELQDGIDAIRLQENSGTISSETANNQIQGLVDDYNAKVKQIPENIDTTPFQLVGTNCGQSLKNATTDAINDGDGKVRGAVEQLVKDATANPVSASIKANITINPNYNLAVSPDTFMAQKLLGYNAVNSGGTEKSNTKSKHASGGYVYGGPQLSWLAEEGWGEFIIPTNPSRRERALELYEKAGKALGVSAHAAGGYVGDNRETYYTGSEENDGNSKTSFVPYQMGVSGGNTSVQVSVSMSPEFSITTEGGEDEESIISVISSHLREMADELGGEIADKLGEVFSNMPVR